VFLALLRLCYEVVARFTVTRQNGDTNAAVSLRHCNCLSRIQLRENTFCFHFSALNTQLNRGHWWQVQPQSQKRLDILFFGK